MRRAITPAAVSVARECAQKPSRSSAVCWPRASNAPKTPSEVVRLRTVLKPRITTAWVMVEMRRGKP